MTLLENTDDDEFDLENLVDLEQRFYDKGHKEGYEQGKTLGHIEGHVLGREKGFELWEELGFYEGFADVWEQIFQRHKDNDNRIAHNARVLRGLIKQFPSENPSHADFAELDVLKLLSQTRSRYKMLCSLVGVKPSLRASRKNGSPPISEGGIALEDDEASKPPSGSRRRANVWKIESSSADEPDFSF
ncbi:DUF1715-domain-containing protein [Schizopora paradoxa]|uniref:DUF1715-domain-containing protein n=1 Tax=Schizopora paradoxa TaxID=27342 RepID=A0A0H2R8L0_9AGAM|nr:DUF1715-domain-containing protein [Schizopora paradoxa]